MITKDLVPIPGVKPFAIMEKATKARPAHRLSPGIGNSRGLERAG
jgi:hypothetical protein